ncbi:KLH10 protein, partial [Polypterus senegalus]
MNWQSMERKLCAVDYNVLNELRLERSFLDVVISVNGVEFPAHKNVLCCSSPYFRTLFSNRCDSKDKKTFTIPGISPEMMEMIITFAYNQTVPVTSENAEQLLIVAHQFNIPGLIRLCSNFLESRLCLRNCIGICKLAYHYCCLELHFKAFRFILHQFEDLVRESEEFLLLSFTELCEIIERDDLNVRNESLVFNAVMKWIYHQPEDRKSLLRKLLPKVRLALRDSENFLENIRSYEHMRNKEYKMSIYIALLQMIYDLGIKESATPHLACSMAHSRLPNSILLAIGGWRGSNPTNAIEAYDARAKVWTEVLHEEDSPRAYHGTVFVKGYVYVIGGCDKVKFYNRVCRYDPVQRVWQEVAPTHSRRCYVSVVVLNDVIYAMGGFDGYTRLKTAEKYNLETNQWTLLPSMNDRRSDASAATLHRKIYICGGFSGEDYLITAEVFNPKVNQWSLITPMSTPRSGLGVVAYKDEVYAVGGFDGLNRLDTVEAYNPLTGLWRTVSSMSTPRSNFGIETMEDLLYVVGGYDGFTTFATVKYYNKENDKWKDLPNITVDRSALSCCVMSGLSNIQTYAAARELMKPDSQSAECKLSPFSNKLIL